jgi:hypothetical protein
MTYVKLALRPRKVEDLLPRHADGRVATQL